MKNIILIALIPVVMLSVLSIGNDSFNTETYQSKQQIKEDSNGIYIEYLSQNMDTIKGF